MKINQSMFFPFLSFFSISIICFSRFLTARIRILFFLSSSLLHTRVGIRSRISTLKKRSSIFLTFLPYPDPDSSTRIRIRIRIKKTTGPGSQKKTDADPQPGSAFFFFFSLHCFFLGMGILIWNRTESQISTRKNGKK